PPEEDDDISWEEADKKYKNGYVPGRYRTTVIVFEGEVTVASYKRCRMIVEVFEGVPAEVISYDQQSPEYGKVIAVVAPGQKFIQETMVDKGVTLGPGEKLTVEDVAPRGFNFKVVRESIYDDTGKEESYVSGKYRTIIEVYAGDPAKVTPYDERDAKDEESVLVKPGEKFIQETKIGKGNR
ncbi:MAG: hypothetical protein KJ569_06490, partial [Candidatus Omnitrophica bacterium]|nr:hypothetical protein [Candidatus Omnitrophota bacterium]